jgi:purine-cytosine permease-like protein
MAPGATVIMILEYLWFQRQAHSDEIFQIPKFSELPALKHAAVWALFSGITSGLATAGIFSSLQFLHGGICSLQSWFICGAVYLVLRTIELRQQRVKSDSNLMRT